MKAGLFAELWAHSIHKRLLKKVIVTKSPSAGILARRQANACRPNCAAVSGLRHA
jgi:hypothetical protein